MIKEILRNLIETFLSAFFMWSGKRVNNNIALTFDDGPHPQYTKKILSILAENNVRATFFLVGKEVEKRPEIVRSIVQEGHEIGNHSYSHDDLLGANLKSIHNEIMYTYKLLEKFSPGYIFLLRLPRGEWNIKIVFYIMVHRLTTVFWSINSKDYLTDNKDEIIHNINFSKLRPGDIILLHDKSEATVEALKTIISKIRSEKLSFTTVSEMRSGSTINNLRKQV